MEADHVLPDYCNLPSRKLYFFFVSRGFQDWSGHWGGNSSRLRVEWDGLDLSPWPLQPWSGGPSKEWEEEWHNTRRRWLRGARAEREGERPTTLGPVGVGCESILVGVCFAVGWGGLNGGSRWFVGLLAVVVRGFGRANRGHWGDPPYWHTQKGATLFLWVLAALMYPFPWRHRRSCSTSIKIYQVLGMAVHSYT